MICLWSPFPWVHIYLQTQLEFWEASEDTWTAFSPGLCSCSSLLGKAPPSFQLLSYGSKMSPSLKISLFTSFVQPPLEPSSQPQSEPYSLSLLPTASLLQFSSYCILFNAAICILSPMLNGKVSKSKNQVSLLFVAVPSKLCQSIYSYFFYC